MSCLLHSCSSRHAICPVSGLRREQFALLKQVYTGLEPIGCAVAPFLKGPLGR